MNTTNKQRNNRKILMKLLEDSFKPGPPTAYSDEQISGWMSQFNLKMQDLTIPGCPFSYATVCREYMRRLLSQEN